MRVILYQNLLSLKTGTYLIMTDKKKKKAYYLAITGTALLIIAVLVFSIPSLYTNIEFSYTFFISDYMYFSFYCLLATLLCGVSSILIRRNILAVILCLLSICLILLYLFLNYAAQNLPGG